MSDFFWIPSQKDLNDLDIILAEQTKKLKEDEREINAIREFKNISGLSGEDLGKVFDDYWNNGNPKTSMNSYIINNVKPSSKPKRGRPKKIKESEPDLKLIKKKISKAEQLYNKLLNDPKISTSEKNQIKRNTNQGKNLDYEVLLSIEKQQKFLNEDSSDEEDEPKQIEKPKRGRPKKKTEKEKENDRENLKIEAEMKQFLFQLVNKNVIDADTKNHILKGIEDKRLKSVKDIEDLIKPHVEPEKVKVMSKLRKALAKRSHITVLKANTEALLKNGKVLIDSEVALRKGLTVKEKKAIKMSVDTAIDRKIKEGKGLPHRHPIYRPGIDDAKKAKEYFEYCQFW